MTLNKAPSILSTSKLARSTCQVFENKNNDVNGNVKATIKFGAYINLR